MKHGLPIDEPATPDRQGQRVGIRRWSWALILTLTAGLLPCGPCPAQVLGVRQFPPTAKRGVLQVTQPPDVLLDGQPARLSPGVRIKSTNNLIVLSASLVGQRLTVNYVTDHQGLLHDVWILTGQEAQMTNLTPSAP